MIKDRGKRARKAEYERRKREDRIRENRRYGKIKDQYSDMKNILGL